MAEASSTEDVITLRIRFKSETIEKFAERYAADLGPDEVFVRTREPLAVGTQLQFDFTLKDGSPLLNGRGRVAWSREPDVARPEPSGMGIRFEVLSTQSRLALGRILDMRARQARRTPAAGSPVQSPVQLPSTVPTANPYAATVEQQRPKLSSSSSSDLPSMRPTPAIGVTTEPTRKTPAKAKALVPADEDAERTEIAKMPPKFYYDNADEEAKRGGGGGGDQIHDGENLLDDLDDITSPRAELPPVTRTVPPRAPEPPIAWKPPTAPPAGSLAAALRGPSQPPTAAVTRPPVASARPPEPHHGPGHAPAGERRHSGSMPIPQVEDTGQTSRMPAAPRHTPSASMPRFTPPEPEPPESDTLIDDPYNRVPVLPSHMPSHIGQPPEPPLDSGMSAPAWATMDATDPLPRGRGGTGKTWLAMALMAGAVVVGALWVFPRVMNRDGQVGQVGSEQPVAAADPVAPPGEPAAAPAAPGAVVPPSAGSAAAVAVPPPAALPPAAAVVEAPGAKPSGPAGATPPVAQATPPAPAPSVVPVTSAAGKPGRRIRNVGPVRRRPSEAPAVAEIPPAPGEAAAPGDAPAPGATVGSEAATDEVFWLSVRSTPPGADVLIDGQVEGKTPFQRRIFDPNRSYALTIRKPGFEAIERSLGSGEQWIKKGNVRTLTVNARLNPAADTTATEQKPGETAPPAERKSNPFDEPAPASGPQP